MNLWVFGQHHLSHLIPYPIQSFWDLISSPPNSVPTYLLGRAEIKRITVLKGSLDEGGEIQFLKIVRLLGSTIGARCSSVFRMSSSP